MKEDIHFLAKYQVHLDNGAKILGLSLKSDPSIYFDIKVSLI